MSEDLKGSVVLRGLLEDRKQAVRVALAAEQYSRAKAIKAEAEYHERMADRIDAESQVTLMEAEIYLAEKDEFCREAEAEISAREAADPPGNGGEGLGLPAQQLQEPDGQESIQQLDRAEEETPTGFTIWEGGEPPADEGAPIEYITRGGYRAGNWASEIDWEHSVTHSHPNDVVFYRIVYPDAELNRAALGLSPAASSPEAPGTELASQAQAGCEQSPTRIEDELISPRLEETEAALKQTLEEVE